jgi:hypothetical protein
MILTMTALAASTAGFILLCNFLSQMVTWILTCSEKDNPDLIAFDR